ncbi:hypothetical protein U1Q18_023183 [Sarracenia purpurea var. burkii]
MGAMADRLVKRLKTFWMATYFFLITQNYKQLKEVEDDAKLLSTKLKEIQSFLTEAKEKQPDDPPQRDWIGKLSAATHDGEEALESFVIESRRWQEKQKKCRFKFCRPCSASEIAYKLDAAEEIKNVLKRLDQIQEEKDKFHLSAISNRKPRTVPPPSDKIQRTTSAAFDPDVVGWEDEKNRVIDMLSAISNLKPRIVPPPPPPPPPPPEKIQRTSLAVFDPDVIGREDDMNRVVGQLISDEYNREGDISCLNIVGEDGLGKTTLAQLVYDDVRVKSHFDSRMWTCVADSFDFRNIAKGMLEYHTGMKYDITSLSNSQLQSRILHFLAGKRFLLVLDNVSAAPSQVELEQLLRLLNNGGKESKVLVTTQNARVAEILGTQPPYLLKKLGDEDCWMLFEKIAFKRGNDQMGDEVRRDLEEIGREIVRKCNGLPLGVKAMGGILRGNDDVNKWRRVLNQVWEAEALSTVRKAFRNLPEHS